MRKLFLAAALIAMPLTFTGCGGGGEAEVVEQDPNATDSGLSAEEQQGYEEAMEAQRGGPGN